MTEILIDELGHLGDGVGREEAAHGLGFGGGHEVGLAPAFAEHVGGVGEAGVVGDAEQ